MVVRRFARRILRWLLPLPWFFVMGCAGPFRVDVGDGFTSDEAVQIGRAADAWQDVGAQGAGTWRVVRASLPLGTDGETDSDAHEIRLSTRLGSGHFYHVVLHELGHAHGVAHIGERERGVMCWNVELPTCADEITPADMAQCKADGACTP